MRPLMALLVVFTLGCSSGAGPAPKLYSVTGTLLLDGKPLPDTTVVLMPVDMASKSQPCSGRTDESGKFKINTNGNRGATSGVYKVVLGGSLETPTKKATTNQDSMEAYKKSMEAKTKGKPSFPFPKEWASPKTSPKTVEVKEEAIVLNMDI